MIDETPLDRAWTDGSRVRRLRHEGPGSVATTIVRAIADLDGVDPTEMDPLYGSVDPDLLQALLDDDRRVTGDVMFTYRGYRVTVGTDGDIVITEASNPGSE